MNLFQEISKEFGKSYVSSFIPWDQTADGLIGVTPKTRAGACAGYCLYWLKSLNQGKTTFPPTFKDKLAAINAQNAFYETGWKEVFAQKGVGITSQKVNWLKTTALKFETKNTSKAVSEAIGTIDTSLALHLVLSNGSSHLVALVASDKNVSMFDPNYGQIVFNRSFTNQFMENYLTGFHHEFNNGLSKVETFQTSGDFNLAPIF
jgi:hypothetical protein